MKNTLDIGKSWGLGISLAVGFIASTAIISKTMYDLKSLNHTISVKGYAERKVRSEHAIWSGSLSIKSPKLQDAYKQLKVAQDLMKGLLQKEGALEAEIGWGSVEKNELNKREFSERGTSRDTNEVEYYVLSQKVAFSSVDISKITKIYAAINDFITSESNNISEINISNSGIQYYYPSDKLEKLKFDLLSEATLNAKVRAEQFAKNSGAKVGRLLHARQGVFQVVGENSTATWDTYDTGSFDKIVKCVADLSFITSE